MKRLLSFSAIAVAMVSSTVGCASLNLPKKESVTTQAAQVDLRNLNARKISFSNVPYDTGKPVKVGTMRKFPYPYEAMLAISNDADHETLRKFNMVHLFINTKRMTPFGYYGVGLDFSDSFFMYNGTNLPQIVDWHNEHMSNELTWYKGVSNQPYGASLLNHYIQTGWIDTLHSWGDFSRTDPKTTLFSRNLAKQAVSTLITNGDTLTVWTDHGNMSNKDGFGAYGLRNFFNYQQGANPGSPYYHTDLTIPYGVKFVWPDLTSAKFSMTSVIYSLKLPDGHTVWGFHRYTSSMYGHNGQSEYIWSVGGLSTQITKVHLSQLIATQGYCIIAQHLYASNSKLPLPSNAIDALWLLAHQYDNGNILVARTSRLLAYNVVQQYVSYRVTYSAGKAFIHIDSINDPVFGPYKPSVSDLHGVTFYTTNPAKTVLEIGDTPIPSQDIQYNHSDGVSPSIGVQWYPKDTTSYVQTLPGVL